jgi:lantibiotic modifying enzyme
MVPTWDSSGTDEMRMVHGVERFEGAQNQPTLNGEPVRPLDYSEAMIAGFAEMYELLLRERVGLMAADGPLAAFAEDDMRIVLRATMIYSMLLKDGRHPDLMRNGLDRERHWDKLWVGIDYQPELEPVIRHERHDLRQDDIPLFWIRPMSRDLWTATGERIADYFEEPGMALTRQRLLKMSAADLAQQLWFVRAALSTLMMRDDEGKVALDYGAAQGQPVSCESLVAAAEAMGDRLAETAFWYGEEVGWLGLSVTAENWSLSPLGSDLYAGVPGVTLFLAYLGAVTGREKYRRLAEAG